MDFERPCWAEPVPQGAAEVLLIAGLNGPLTAREREILSEVACGKTAKEIARSLGISINTVKFHTRNTLFKLGARNMTAAVARALTLGFLP
ncbi:MAG: helix-turn-helix domain-containing protein [Pseudomonas sp.]|uniref:helix-turn-helix domain-containing protein n=1 Tax=Pseudomonas sp. TaxID=306 RepID=UPI003D0DC5CA